jgi:hypothetical protein
VSIASAGATDRINCALRSLGKKVIWSGLGYLNSYQITRTSDFATNGHFKVNQSVVLGAPSLTLSLGIFAAFSRGNKHFDGLSDLLLVLLPSNVVHHRQEALIALLNYFLR